jgi:hypothetical protein
VGGEKALGGVGERLAGAVASTVIGRDETVTPDEAVGCGETGYACCGSKTGGEKLST